jgi:hypothetical protein
LLRLAQETFSSSFNFKYLIEKLLNLTDECRLLNLDYVELNPLLYRAFEAMQERSVLFKYSLSDYVIARRNNIVRAYIDALTRSGS